MQRALGGGFVQRDDGAFDSLFGVIEVAIVDVLSRGPYERSDTGPQRLVSLSPADGSSI
jgi:hypothetical protein